MIADACGNVEDRITLPSGNFAVTDLWSNYFDRCTALLPNAPCPSPKYSFALLTGECLHPNQSIHSPDGRYALTLRSDGMVVLQGPQRITWAVANGWQRPVVDLRFLGDGNLMLETMKGPMWSTLTSNKGGWVVSLQNDGTLVIWSTQTGTPIWQTHTAGQT